MKRRIAAVVIVLVLFASSVSLADNAGENGRTQTNFSAAFAAEMARAYAKKSPNAEEWRDITQNGVFDETDVFVALDNAAGNIPDIVKFVETNACGLIDEKDYRRFSYNGTIEDGRGNFRSDSVSVTTSVGEWDASVYYFSDIYVRDVDSIQTSVSESGLSREDRYVLRYAERLNAVLAMNGDYYTAQNKGPIVRNGKTILEMMNRFSDLCVLTGDGVLTTYPRRTIDKETFFSLDVRQSWVFGPALLDETGEALSGFSSEITGRNPRSVIGYFSPGHYCFLLVDGRQEGYSLGVSLDSLAKLCKELGMAAAYNLDGGQSSAMATSAGLVDIPVHDGRPVSDVVYVARPE